MSLYSHLSQIVQCFTMDLFNMKIHTAPVGENSLTVGAGKLLAKMDRVHVSFQVGLSREVLATVLAREYLQGSAMFLLLVSD